MFVYELNKYNLRAPQNLWFTLRALFEAHKVECYDNVYSLVFTKVVIFHYDYFYILTLVQFILHIWLIGLSKPTSTNLELNFSRLRFPIKQTTAYKNVKMRHIHALNSQILISRNIKFTLA